MPYNERIEAWKVKTINLPVGESGSSLLRLPYEPRVKIYEAAFSSKRLSEAVFWIYRSKTGLLNVCARFYSLMIFADLGGADFMRHPARTYSILHPGYGSTHHAYIASFQLPKLPPTATNLSSAHQYRSYKPARLFGPKLYQYYTVRTDSVYPARKRQWLWRLSTQWSRFAMIAYLVLEVGHGLSSIFHPRAPRCWNWTISVSTQ
jgi:hypothetical protein